MQIKFFTVPINCIDSFNDEINRFLISHKILEIEKHLVQSSSGACWCLCINYLASPASQFQQKIKIDYKEVLDEKTFTVFQRLREIRKNIADEDAVSAFVVFTDAELAEISKLTEITEESLKKIQGIGEKKVEKYGFRLLSMFKAV
jgi:superfamily II DNA helicase RecQ